MENTPNIDSSIPLKSIQIPEPRKAYPCDKCPKSFSTPQGVTLHKIRVHSRKRKISPTALKAIRRSQAARRAREKSERNGSQPVDHLADAARAITLAAQVIRAVSVGMKL